MAHLLLPPGREFYKKLKSKPAMHTMKLEEVRAAIEKDNADLKPAPEIAGILQALLWPIFRISEYLRHSVLPATSDHFPGQALDRD